MGMRYVYSLFFLLSFVGIALSNQKEVVLCEEDIATSNAEKVKKFFTKLEKMDPESAAPILAEVKEKRQKFMELAEKVAAVNEGKKDTKKHKKTIRILTGIGMMGYAGIHALLNGFILGDEADKGEEQGMLSVSFLTDAGIFTGGGYQIYLGITGRDSNKKIVDGLEVLKTLKEQLLDDDSIQPRSPKKKKRKKKRLEEEGNDSAQADDEDDDEGNDSAQDDEEEEVEEV